MHNTTNPKGIQLPTPTTTAGGERRQGAVVRHRFEAIVWVISLLLFIISCFFVHAHPAPYAIDLSTTETVQHLRLWPWLEAILRFPSTLDNPLPSLIGGIFWSGVMFIMGLIFWLRKKSPLIWFQNGVFFAITVLGSAGMNVLVDILVNRPRPDPHKYPIHLDTPLVPFPTYPSGHTEHDVAYYGFLLYLSFTRPVREWRYRWLLIPLQIFAIYDILAIGYSRVLEGDHWLTDVLGGYLEGAIYLFVFIFLYRGTTRSCVERLQGLARANRRVIKRIIQA
jgi:membrane-associated phospholipid phosphatase